MNVVCVGLGYVGAVTAGAFAAIGHDTVVIDIDSRKTDRVNAGECPIFEPGLEPLIRYAVPAKLRAATSYEAVADADVVLIGVGTPSLPNGASDVSFVASAAKSIGEHLNPARYTVVVVKSTVPAGTSDLVASIIEDASGARADDAFAVVSNPEFLREGFAVEDVLFPDRIVVGTSGSRAKSIIRQLYHGIVERIPYEKLPLHSPLLHKMNDPKPIYFETDAKNAEMIKYASNAFLAVKVSYINEIARLCEALGVNVLDVAKGMGLDPRIGHRFLQVSSGWSGSCFPKDTSELLATSRQYDCKLPVVEAAIESNRMMLSHCVGKLQRRLKSLNGKKIGVLGLTFKPDTDDARETQASVIIRKLLEAGAAIAVHDPKGMEMFRRLNPELPIRYCDKGEDIAHKADAIVLLTHWNEYRELDWRSMLEQMRTPYVLDTRNFLDKDSLLSLGFLYEGNGVP